MGEYRTIVADPPWHYGRMGGGYAWRKGKPSGVSGRPMLAYQTMSVEEIAALPVVDQAADDAHLYIWTTQRYLWDAPAIARAWGFEPNKILTWAKAPTGFCLGGAWGNSSEFILFAKRGKLKAQERVPRDWFGWKRGAHSQKPEEFQDLVEQISPGPYLELFARRERLGWDTWGDQSANSSGLQLAA